MEEIRAGQGRAEERQTRAPAERGSRVLVGQEEDEVGAVFGGFRSELFEGCVEGRHRRIHQFQRHPSTPLFLVPKSKWLTIQSGWFLVYTTDDKIGIGFCSEAALNHGLVSDADIGRAWTWAGLIRVLIKYHFELNQISCWIRLRISIPNHIYFISK